MGVTVRNVQLDVPPEVHDEAMAWWAAVLGGTPRSVGGPYTHLDGVRSWLGVHVQRQVAGPGRVHLDLEADDPDTEVERLVELGAMRVRVAADGDERAWVLRDPAGLEFCVTDRGQEQHLDEGRTPNDLRILVLDVPAAVADAELAFWAAALEGEPGHSQRYDEFAWVAGVAGPTGADAHLLVQTLGGDGEAARIHLDLHVPDAQARDAEVDRLVALGARVVTREPGPWVVLAPPGGHLVCVVPDTA